MPKKKQHPATLAPDQLRWTCNLDILPFETTEEVDPAHGIVGQSTAMEALKFGLQCLVRGQNVYVRGARGTGRILMVHQLLDELQPQTNEKRDFCYVHNFQRPDHPRLITLPPGSAPDFRHEVLQLIEFLEEGLGKAIESEPHLSRRQSVQEKVQAEIETITSPLEADLKASGMALVATQQGPASQTMILPLVEGQPVPSEQLRLLVSQGKAPAQQLEAFEKAYPDYQKRLLDTSRRVNELLREAAQQDRELNESIIRSLWEEVTQPILKKFSGPKIELFLNDIVNDVVELRLYGSSAEGGPDFKARYDVNIVLTHTDRKSRPVIEESTPSLINLLGTVEPKWGPGGTAVSDYRGIRAGALLMADAGYLILDVNDLISEPGAWRALMRTLRTEQLEIVPPELGWMRQQVITQPEPIDINVRVVLIGDLPTYYQLDHFDSDFRELFKVLADFDSEMTRDDTGVMQYANVVAKLCETESLPPFHRSAVAALAEHGARIVSRQGKLTARFGRIADIAAEAAFLAGKRRIMAKHVKQAIQRTKDRASLPSRKFRELVENETLMVQTDGDVVGQINGLAVMHSGPLTYGFPARITATIGPGSAGLINIEGRAQMSGSIHTKGFQILGGLLRHLLKTKHPMAFSASLAFEQSYGGIDGDSASGAEIVCLLSALTDVPIKQGMAMTGAIDQLGHLEAIGGVNEKVEGFFDACDYFGLTGDQGVVIPKSNAGDLMLREDIVKACKKGKFHVFAVDNIYEAIELMTGQTAGQPNDEGKYPEGSVLAQAHDRVEQFWRLTLASPQQLSRVERASGNDDDQPIVPLSIRNDEQ